MNAEAATLAKVAKTQVKGTAEYAYSFGVLQ